MPTFAKATANGEWRRHAGHRHQCKHCVRRPCRGRGDDVCLPNGRLVPRSPPDAMIHGTDAAAERLVEFLATGQMPTLNSLANDLAAQFICVHSDSEGAVIMAHSIRAAFAKAGIALTGFLRWPDAYNAIRGFGLGQRMDHPALAVAFWLRVARYQLKIHRFDRIAMSQAPVRFPAASHKN